MYVNDFERHVLDDDLDSWEYLIDQGHLDASDVEYLADIGQLDEYRHRIPATVIADAMAGQRGQVPSRTMRIHPEMLSHLVADLSGRHSTVCAIQDSRPARVTVDATLRGRHAIVELPSLYLKRRCSHDYFDQSRK